MKTTRVKFDDLRGMLNADEMRGIIGGSGGVELNPYGSQSGATYTDTPSDPMAAFLNNLFSSYVGNDPNNPPKNYPLGYYDNFGTWHSYEHGPSGGGCGASYTGSTLNGSSELNYLTSFAGFNDWVNSEQQANSNLSFFSSLANWNAGIYTNQGNGNWLYNPEAAKLSLEQKISNIMSKPIGSVIEGSDIGLKMGGVVIDKVTRVNGGVMVDLTLAGNWTPGLNISDGAFIKMITEKYGNGSVIHIVGDGTIKLNGEKVPLN